MQILGRAIIAEYEDGNYNYDIYVHLTSRMPRQLHYTKYATGILANPKI